MYNYNHLYYFYITVKSGGVTSGAKHLSISQPSLSGQLKVLEGFLKIKLFKKIRRKNELTPDGALIFGFCRQMFEISEEMSESISEKIPFASRKIYIGVSNQIANSFVVEVISRFLSQFNDQIRPRVVMISGSHEKLAEQLRFRELDVVVSPLLMADPELHNLQRVEVPVNLVCAFNEKLISRTKFEDITVALKAITEDRVAQWVMPSSGVKLRSELDAFFDVNLLKGKVVFESDVVESLTRSVVDNIGMAFLPLIYVAKEIQNKSVISFGPKKGYWKYRLWIASHIKNKNDPLINSLSLSFKEVCTPLLPKA